MKTLLFMIMAAVCLTITAHAQLGLTLAQCRAKFGKGTDGAGIAIFWDRHGLKMSVDNSEDPVTHVSYTSRHPLPMAQLWNENLPGGEWIIDPNFTPWMDKADPFPAIVHMQRWINNGASVSAEEIFVSPVYNLEIQMH
jgi:hypothetical protein